MSLVSKEKEEATESSFRIPRGQEIMGDPSEIDEVPISDPPATHPRTWSESSASFADQLISPTSAGSGFSLETSGEFEFEICGRCGKGVLSILSSSVLIRDMIVHVMQASCPRNSLPCMAQEVYFCKVCDAHSTVSTIIQTLHLSLTMWF